jgi:dTMP kinase
VSGRFIVIDGPDGAGKSTLAAALADKLGAAVLTREPFYEATRELLFPAARASPSELAIAMAHDRHQHMRREVEPALAAGYTVICDRYVLSTLVYQHEALADFPDRDAILAFLTAGAREPELTIVVDVPPLVARARQAGKNRDRFEDDAGLQQRVRQRYLGLAQQRGYPVIDGGATADSTLRQALALVAEAAR